MSIALPLDWPGLFSPGPDLINMLRTDEAATLHAALKADKKTPIPAAVRQQLRTLVAGILYGETRSISLTYKNCTVPCSLLPGHIWTADADAVGPAPSNIMVVNKMTYNDDIAVGSAMLGETAQMFYQYLCDLSLDPSEWYVTNFIKSQHPEWDTKTTTITAGMIAEFKPILQQEILLVQPQIILCLGVEALNAVIGQKTTMTKAKETVYEIPFLFPQQSEIADEKYFAEQKQNGYKDTRFRAVSVIGVPHPHAVLRAGDRGSLDGLNTDINFFAKQINRVLIGGVHTAQTKEQKLDHRVIWSLDQYEDLADEIEETCEDNLISIDAEWNGSHPQNLNAYLRCFQLSWKNKTAACIALASPTEDCDMRKPYYYRGWDHSRIIEITRRVIKGRRLVGHFIEADLEFLVPFGLDLRQEFQVPTTWEKYRKAWLNKEPCGFDTARAIHAVSETSKLSLKEQARLYTEAGRYDKELDDWIDVNTLKDKSKGTGKTKKKRLDGYGIIPDELLHAYAAYDADVTRRLALIYTEKLSSDEFGNDCWRPFWIAMRALLPILEIDCTGLLLNRDRLEELTEQYQDLSEMLLREIRGWARWPDFNPRSYYHMRELLFGEKYNRKTLSQKEIETLPRGTPVPEYVRIRPRGAKTLGLTPLFTTDKYPKAWDRVIQEGREHFATPSTNNDTLIQLKTFYAKRKVITKQGGERTVDFSPILTKLWSRNIVAQTLKYVLKPPKTDENFQPVYDNDGNLLYDKGIPSCVCDDGRVRTSIMFGKATGRWSSINPSLQNIGKKAEDYLKEILQEDYRYPLKSIFRAAPDHVFISADYIGAEIACAAFLCGDQAMLEHVRRNQLPEDDPLFYDIHSRVAVSAFRLDCEPTKNGLKAIHKRYLRDIAKAILFGLFYGRSPRAIAEGAKSEGICVSEEEAAAIVDHIREEYPLLLPFFDTCALRAENPRWLTNAFGRYRRFPTAIDNEQLKRFERQAKNSPIQGTVADVVNRATDYFCYYRDKWKLKTKLVLQIHDDIMAEVPNDEVEIVYKKLFPKAMVQCVPILVTGLNGKRVPNAVQHRLGIDLTVSREWGIPVSDLSEWGV